MKELLIAFAAIVVYKLISNLVNLLRCIYYENKYMEFLASRKFNFAEYTYPVKKLFQRAGIGDSSFQFAQPIGWGQLATGTARVTDNMNVLDDRVVANMATMFSVAKGTYKSRTLESLNPLYWIECVIFLPKKLMEYFGVSGEKSGVKILQVIYWILAPLLVGFRTQIYEYIANLIGKM